MFLYQHDFVYIYGKISNERLIVDCNCSTFSSLNQLFHSYTLNPQYTIGSCCRTRFLKDAIPIIEPTIEPVAELPAFINVNKIKEGISSSQSNVVLLKSKKSAERYSVCADDGDVQFVTIFTVSKGKRKVVQCHSSICKLREGDTRSLLTLQLSGTIYKHLIAFREFYLTNIPHGLQENVGDSYEDETVYESIAENHCLPDDKVEVSLYTFLGT